MFWAPPGQRVLCCCDQSKLHGLTDADIELEPIASSRVNVGSVPEPPTEVASSCSKQVVVGEEYRVEIDRTFDVQLGLQFYTDAVTEVSGIVRDVMAGSACCEDVKKGDRLVEVNGCRDSFAKLSKMMQEMTHLSLTFKRPKEFTIKVVKDADLGVQLAMSRDSEFLFIKSFQESGALQDFNQRRTTGKLREFDCIIEVNGYRGPCTQLLQIIQQERTLKLKMHRFLSKVELAALPKGSAPRRSPRIGGA